MKTAKGSGVRGWGSARNRTDHPTAEIGDRRGRAYSLNNLSIVTFQLGELDEAGRLFYEALQIASEIRKASTILALLVEFALLWAKQGKQQEAFALASFARSHPAIDSEFRDYAETLYNQLSPVLPAWVKSTALIRCGSLDAAVAR